jgi:hypothetical protein
MEFVGRVQCECGHRFFTTKAKTQCSKCKKRFPAFFRAHTDVAQEKDNTIIQLKTKLIQYEEIIKKLIPKIEKEQKENLEELKKLLLN